MKRILFKLSSRLVTKTYDIHRNNVILLQRRKFWQLSRKKKIFKMELQSDSYSRAVNTTPCSRKIIKAINEDHKVSEREPLVSRMG